MLAPALAYNQYFHRAGTFVGRTSSEPVTCFESELPRGVTSAISFDVQRSVPEVAHSGEDHRESVRVGGGDDLGVTHRAARLRDRGGARLGRERRSVGERKQRLGDQH